VRRSVRQAVRRFWRLIPAFLAGMATLACTDLSDSGRLADGKVRDALPTQEFENVEMVHTRKGEPVFRMQAPRLDQYGNQKRAELYGGITIDFYKEGRISSHLTADSGVVLKNGDELRGIGNVIVTTDTGTTILTPRMTWTRFDGLITSDTIVTIITEYDTLHGTGLVATDDLKKRRILQPSGVSTRGLSRAGGVEGSGPTELPPGESVPVDTASYPFVEPDSTAQDSFLELEGANPVPPDSTVGQVVDGSPVSGEVSE